MPRQGLLPAGCRYTRTRSGGCAQTPRCSSDATRGSFPGEGVSVWPSPKKLPYTPGMENKTHSPVDAQGLVHVDNHKVVIPRLGARELVGVKLGRLLQDAQEGGDVGLLLGGRDVAPAVSPLSANNSSNRPRGPWVMIMASLPFPADTELVLGACLRLGELGVNAGPALVLEIEHSVGRHEAQEQEPGDCKQPDQGEASHGGFALQQTCLLLDGTSAIQRRRENVLVNILVPVTVSFLPGSQ